MITRKSYVIYCLLIYLKIIYDSNYVGMIRRRKAKQREQAKAKATGRVTPGNEESKCEESKTVEDDDDVEMTTNVRKQRRPSDLDLQQPQELKKGKSQKEIARDVKRAQALLNRPNFDMTKCTTGKYFCTKK